MIRTGAREEEGAMGETVLVSIPVTAEVAKMLEEPWRREVVGRLVTGMVRPSRPEEDPLARLFAEAKADARAAGLTEEEIDAELEAYNAEGRD
jgi:hypothetical protein